MEVGARLDSGPSRANDHTRPQRVAPMTRPPPIPVSVRAPGPSDAPGLGLAVFAALFDAPSSPLLPEELGDDLLAIGQELIDGAVFGDEVLLAAYDAAAPVAVARVTPREFMRGAHIGTLQILVSPAWRRRGIGAQLLGAIVDHRDVRRRFERLEIHNAATDDASRTLLQQANACNATHHQWAIERLEKRAMRIDGVFVDVELWVRDLEAP